MRKSLQSVPERLRAATSDAHRKKTAAPGGLQELRRTDGVPTPVAGRS